MTLSHRELVLPAVPGLAGVYAQAAVAAGRLAVARRLGRAPVALPEVSFQVSGVRPVVALLTDYQHLLGEPASDLLPAGFVHVVAFPVATALMARSDFPLPLLGMVHLANRVTQLRAVRLGETLDVRAWAQHLRPHRSGTQVDIVTEVSVDDEVVWTGVSTYLSKTPSSNNPRLTPTSADEPWIARGMAPDGANNPRVGGPEGAGAAGGAGAGGGVEGFVPPVPTGQWRLAGDVGRRYAGVSGDRNPIHLSALSAKALGFPRAIAHGMYTAARALADVGATRGERFVWTVDFTKPVLLPSSPSVRVARDGDGFAYVVWRPGASAPHLTGRVDPLREQVTAASG